MLLHKLKSKALIIIVALLIGATPINAIASGGGGGGGGGFSGSSSGPSVDPAKAYRKGLEAYNEGNYKKSAREFKKVLSVVKKNPEANYYAGMSYIGLEKPKKAMKYFRNAVKARPNFREAREQYALTAVSLEKMDVANAQLAAMKEMSTENKSAKLASSIERVKGAIETGQIPDQLTLAFAPSGNIDQGDILYSNAVRLINTKQYQAAITVLYDVQAEIGVHADIQNYLGYTHRKLGHYDAAKAYYTTALKLNPKHLGANEYLGELYVELGDLKKARRQLAKLDKLCDFGCEEREELARLLAPSDVQVALSEK